MIKKENEKRIKRIRRERRLALAMAIITCFVFIVIWFIIENPSKPASLIIGSLLAIPITIIVMEKYPIPISENDWDRNY